MASTAAHACFASRLISSWTCLSSVRAPRVSTVSSGTAVLLRFLDSGVVNFGCGRGISYWNVFEVESGGFKKDI